MQTLLIENTDIERYLNTISKLFYKKYKYLYSIEEILSLAYISYNKAIKKSETKELTTKKIYNLTFSYLKLECYLQSKKDNNLKKQNILSLDYVSPFEEECKDNDFLNFQAVNFNKSEDLLDVFTKNSLYSSIKELDKEETELIISVFFQNKNIHELSNLLNIKPYQVHRKLDKILRKLKYKLVKKGVTL